MGIINSCRYWKEQACHHQTSRCSRQRPPWRESTFQDRAAPSTCNPLHTLRTGCFWKVTLLQNLGILPTGRNALGQENQHKEQLEELSRLFHAANRQFGGGLGGLGGLLGGGNGGTAGNLVDGATNALVEQAIQQWMANGGVENLIMQFISGGGLELMVTQFFSNGGFESLVAGAMANLDEQALQSLGQAAGENIQQELANIDMEGMMESMTSELEGDLDQMMAALEEAVANNQIEEPQMELSCKCQPRT